MFIFNQYCTYVELYHLLVKESILILFLYIIMIILNNSMTIQENDVAVNTVKNHNNVQIREHQEDSALNHLFLKFFF